jgi:hypothetical protein
VLEGNGSSTTLHQQLRNIDYSNVGYSEIGFRTVKLLGIFCFKIISLALL